MYIAVFECELGIVGCRYETLEEMEKAYKWFEKKYKKYYPHIKSVKEIITHGTTKSKLQ